MAQYQRLHQHRKVEHHVGVQEPTPTLAAFWGSLKGARPKLLFLLFLSLLSFSIILAPHIFSFSSSFSLRDSFDSFGDLNVPLCSSIPEGSICCDRSNRRSDICIMKGDLRTHSASSSVFLYSSRTTSRSPTNVSGMVDKHDQNGEPQLEKIRPYTRKWETSVMNTVNELKLIKKSEKPGSSHFCDVKHDVPAVFFSTGGYTGNVYHEFNDGILPLYITSQHFNKKVVFVILEYHNWWMMKYGDVVSHLSDYPPIDFNRENRTHCFPEAIAGLRIHDELTVDPSLMKGNRSIVDFRNLLDRAYWPRIRGLIQDEKRGKKANLSLAPLQDSYKPPIAAQEGRKQRPKLVILSRNGSRSITNEGSLVRMAEQVGFRVQVLRPDRTTELAKVYRALNSSDVMVGVHGAAMTHLLFMKPGHVFIQIIPLGTDWAAETYYGEPAKKLGLKYIGYEILPRESSLYGEYSEDDPVIRDPKSITRKGWQYTKEIYLEHQHVNLDLARFKRLLISAHRYSILRIGSRRRSSLMSRIFW